MAAIVPILAVAPDQKSPCTSGCLSSCWETFHQHTRSLLLKDGRPSQVPAVSSTLTKNPPQKRGHLRHCRPSQPTGVWGKINAPCFKVLGSGAFHYIGNASHHIYLFFCSLIRPHLHFNSCNIEKKWTSPGKQMHTVNICTLSFYNGLSRKS